MIVNRTEDFERTNIEFDVVRWQSNNRCVPSDIMAEFFDLGLVTEFQVENTARIREEETDAFLAEYRKFREENGYSDEEKMEMQNAFGGNFVVDIITGKRIV